MNAEPVRDVEALLEELFGYPTTLEELDEILRHGNEARVRDLIRAAAAPPQDFLEELLGPAGAMEKIEACMRYPGTRELARLFPDKPRVGRRRDYQPFMWLVYHMLSTFVYESARATGDEIAHRWIWKRMRAIAKDVFPDEPWMWLPARPMTRWHYAYAKKRYLLNPSLLEDLKEGSMGLAAELARELGLFAEDSKMSWKHLDLNRMTQSDGKVIDPRYRAKRGATTKNRATGEVREVRADPDAAFHTEGGGRAAYGNKFVILSARTERYRVFLTHGFDSGIKGEGGEAAVAMRCFERVAPLLPGAQGVNYDKAMRGVHIDRAARELGWVIATGVFDITDDEDEPKIWHIEDREVELPDGSRTTIRIHARRGAPGLLELDEEGKEYFVELELIKRERRGRLGQYRFYRLVRLPEYLGGGQLRIRTTGDEEDEARGLSRAEHLRTVAETDPDFPALKARRNDAESLNKYLEDTLDRGRAHSVGALAQDADLLGFGLGLNALTWFRNQERRRARPARAA